MTESVKRENTRDKIIRVSTYFTKLNAFRQTVSHSVKRFLFQNFQINQKININKPLNDCNNNKANAN